MNIVWASVIALFSFSVIAGCDFNQGEYIEELNDLGNVKKIVVNVNNSKKWAMNSLRIIKSDSENIKDKFKKKFKSTIDIVYGFGRCSYAANVRQSGDWRDHIELSDGGRLRQSIDIKLKEGNIAGIVKFKLLLPDTRKGQEEVHATSLLRELGYLAPRTILVDTEVNGNEEQYLLQESTRKEMLEYNKRREGPIFEGDESLLWGYQKHPLFLLEKISLARQENIKWALKGKTSLEISLISFGRVQDAYIDYVLNKFSVGHISAGSIDWKLLNLDKDPQKSPYLYELLLLSMNGDHALRPHNRKYYYNPIEDVFEPIYYDGNINTNSDVRFEFTKKEHLVLFENKIDVVGLEKLKSDLMRIEARNSLDIGFSEFIKNTRFNLATVMNSIQVGDRENDDYSRPAGNISNYVNLLFQTLPSSRTVSVNEIFDQTLDAEFCTTEGCSSGVKSHEEIARIMARRGESASLFLSYNKEQESIVTHLVPGPIKIEHSAGGSVDFINGELVLKQSKPDDWFLIRDSIINDTHVKFIGVGGARKNSVQRFNLRGITGCLSIYNSTFNGSSIDVVDGVCEDSINIISSTGTIDLISVSNSYSDGLDSDYSSLDINKIIIENSGNDCADFSYGRYHVDSMYLMNCGDKGISIGELSDFVVNNSLINSQKIGVSSKDSSRSLVKFSEITAPVCAESYNKKQEFGGASLVFEEVTCSNDNYFSDDSSLIAF